MSLRSPLGTVLGLGSAKSGSGHWYAQRVSAVAVTVLGLWLLVSLLCIGSIAHPAILAWLAAPTNAALCALTVVAAAYHAWLGLQVIIEDYVGRKGVRVVTLVATKFLFILAGAAGVLAVLRIAVQAP